jgi:hypothetical protein
MLPHFGKYNEYILAHGKVCTNSWNQAVKMPETGTHTYLCLQVNMKVGSAGQATHNNQEQGS